jgi:hypothetical protein
VLQQDLIDEALEQISTTGMGGVGGGGGGGALGGLIVAKRAGCDGGGGGQSTASALLSSQVSVARAKASAFEEHLQQLLAM